MGQSRQAGDIIGDYRLVEAVSGGALTRTWRAEQISMQREVMLEMLRQDAARDIVCKTSFVADIRAKAAAHHPGIGAVYEAHHDDEATYYARESLEGENLEEWLEGGKELEPLAVVKLIEQIALAQLHLEEKRLATVSLAPHHIVINGENLRMMNLVADGPRDESQSTRDKQLLGALFDEMLTPGLPGSTRVGSLLAYMADYDREIPLTWEQIRKLSRQVIDQLEGNAPQPGEVPPPQVVEVVRPKRKPWWVLGVVGLLGVFGFFLLQDDGIEQEVVDEDPGLPPIEVSPGLLMGAHEVTIGEYREFLDALEGFSEEEQAMLRHGDQPEDKRDHLPDDWAELSSAAASGGIWKGRLVSEGCPVVGIDWWDASAFARWRGGRLPTMSEWRAAASPTEAVSGWGKASAPVKDRTEKGLIGMGGNVREWTLENEINPAYQLRAKRPMACGASFLNPGGGVEARSWLTSRSDQAEDLGFRLVFESSGSE
ncbi:MAG: SUMF1/EgtB/PvdO family nonheme iron enzyme [Verrucomicrobiaceae bacterium]